MRKQKGRRGFLAVCTIPALVLFGIFMIYPTLNIFIISMYKWGGYSQNREFVGLDNFVKLFSDAKFWQSFQNTVLLIVVVTIVTMAMALITAAVLTREKLRFKGFFHVKKSGGKIFSALYFIFPIYCLLWSSLRSFPPYMIPAEGC